MVSLSAFGLLSGVRHAMEPDHLAAVSTMVAAQRSTKATLRYAVLWGIGHATVLFVLGGGLFVFRKAMPASVSNACEYLVALVLVGLGVRAWLSLRRSSPAHAATYEHTHAAYMGSAPMRELPLAIGTLHGFAGSGALAATMLQAGHSFWIGLLSLALYAVGSLLGMAILAGLVGRPLAHLLGKPRVRFGLVFTSGLASVVVGVAWGISHLMHA